MLVAVISNSNPSLVSSQPASAKQVAGVRSAGPQEICAVMPGVVVDVLVAEGDRVDAGQTLLVLEAMKMQNPLHAGASGVVTGVHAATGDAVAGGALLLEIESDAEG